MSYLYECENRGVSNAYVIATMLQYICKRVVRMLYDSVAYATCMNAVHTYAVITLYIQCIYSVIWLYISLATAKELYFVVLAVYVVAT